MPQTPGWCSASDLPKEGVAYAKPVIVAGEIDNKNPIAIMDGKSFLSDRCNIYLRGIGKYSPYLSPIEKYTIWGACRYVDRDQSQDPIMPENFSRVMVLRGTRMDDIIKLVDGKKKECEWPDRENDDFPVPI